MYMQPAVKIAAVRSIDYIAATKNVTVRYGRSFASTLLLFLTACTSGQPPTLLSEKYDYDSIINRSQAAFGARNADVAVEAFEDNGVFYRITDDGVVELVRGKDNLRRSMRMIFVAENGYKDSKAVRLGLIQNVLVMFHEDRYETDDGIKVVPRVVVVEHRNGKRWREWEFNPKDR